MNHTIQISSYDKQRIVRLLLDIDMAEHNREEIADLQAEIARGEEVEPRQMPPDVITMNSSVRVTDIEAGTTSLYTIVFPWDADFAAGRISVLASLGTALLGYRVGEIVEWEMPSGLRRLRIEEIVYQPERAGDFHL